MYEDIRKEKLELLKGTKCVIQADGWKNSVTNTKLLVFSLTNMRSPHLFLTCRNVSSEREFGVNLAAHFNDAIQLAKDLYDADVVASITDNDSKICLGCELARTTNGKPLMRSTCGSHSGNCLIKSMYKNDPRLEVINKVVAAYKDPKVEAHLRRNNGSALKNYPDTRFCYLRDTCESIKKNLPIMRMLTEIEECQISPNICDSVNGVEFENSVNEIYKNISPICILINTCQDPKKNIADAAELWLKLELPTDRYDELIKKRIMKAIKPAGYAANFLHHKYKGLRLDERQIEVAEQFFYDYMDETGIQELEDFIANRDSYETRAKNIDDPVSFWILLEEKYKTLSEFALSLFIMPASSADIEGLFSQWTYVHNKHRNRLSTITSAQLVEIYSYLTHTVPSFRKKPKRSHLPWT